MNADTIFNLEMKLLVFELASIALWVFYRRLPIKLIVAIGVSLLIAVGALRPDNYNSDTTNYASYAIVLSQQKGAGAYIITKIEPIHVLLVALTGDFPLWLIAEGILALFLLWVIYFRTSSPAVFILISALFSTLYTSSMRFAVAILMLSVLLTWNKRSLLHSLAVSVIAGCAHAVMLVSGPFSTRIKWMPMAFTGAFTLIALFDKILTGRVGSDLLNVDSIGLKSFAVFLVICAFSWLRQDERDTKQFLWDVVGFSSVFMITAMFYPYLNRVIVVGSIIILYEIDRKKSLGSYTYLDRMGVGVIFAMITVPYMLSVQDLYRYNAW